MNDNLLVAILFMGEKAVWIFLGLGGHKSYMGHIA